MPVFILSLHGHPFLNFFYVILSVSNTIWYCSSLINHLFHLKHFCLLLFQCFNLLTEFSLHILDFHLQFTVFFTLEIIVLSKSWINFLDLYVCLLESSIWLLTIFKRKATFFSDISQLCLQFLDSIIGEFIDQGSFTGGGRVIFFLLLLYFAHLGWVCILIGDSSQRVICMILASGVDKTWR